MPAASTVDPPLLSIAVLTWNRTTILEKCLRSLLAQNCRGQVFEIIVCDDGSTDGTGQMVRELSSRATNLRYVRQPHKGIAAARNLGLSAARGNLIAFASDEYEFGPGYVQTVLACFREHPEIQAVRFKVVAANRRFGSRVNHWHYSLHFVKRLVPEFSDEPARFHRAVKRLKAMARYKEKLSTEHNLEAAGAAVFRREVFEIVGPFDETLQRAEDTELAARLRTKHIKLYYDPTHEIPTGYERFPDAAIVKQFRGGVNRFRYYRKQAFHSKTTGLMCVTLLVQALCGILEILIFCFRNRILLEVLLCSPFLLLLESANKLGFFSALVIDVFARLRRERNRAPVSEASHDVEL